MNDEQFAEDLADLILLATPCLKAEVMLEILEDEADALRGAVIKQKLEAGPWPPEAKSGGD